MQLNCVISMAETNRINYDTTISPNIQTKLLPSHWRASEHLRTVPEGEVESESEFQLRKGKFKERERRKTELSKANKTKLKKPKIKGAKYRVGAIEKEFSRTPKAILFRKHLRKGADELALDMLVGGTPLKGHIEHTLLSKKEARSLGFGPRDPRLPSSSSTFKIGDRAVSQALNFFARREVAPVNVTPAQVDRALRSGDLGSRLACVARRLLQYSSSESWNHYGAFNVPEKHFDHAEGYKGHDSNVFSFPRCYAFVNFICDESSDLFELRDRVFQHSQGWQGNTSQLTFKPVFTAVSRISQKQKDVLKSQAEKGLNKRKNQASRKIKELAESVENEKSQIEAQRDVEKTKKEEKREMEAERYVEHMHILAMKLPERVFYQVDRSLEKGVLGGRTHVCSYVASTRDSLPLSLGFYDIFVASRLDVFDLNHDDRPSYFGDIQISSRASSYVRYGIEVSHTFCGCEISHEHVGDCSLSLELMAVVARLGLADSVDFEVVRERVSAFVSRFFSVFDDVADDSVLSFRLKIDLLTALLMGRLLRNPSILEVLSSNFVSILTRQIFSYLRKDGCIAPGNYIEGYRLSYSDVFKSDPTVTGGIIFENIGRGANRLGQSIKDQYAGGMKGLAACRQWCRSLVPSIKNVIPCFPEPYYIPNLHLSFVKRLASVPVQLPDEVVVLERELSDALGHEVMKSGKIEDHILDGLAEEYRKSGGGSQFSSRDWADFERGVQMVREFVGGSEEALQRILDQVGRWSVMIKKEFYTLGALKADRFICIPNVVLRGICYALVSPVEKLMESSWFGQFLVKGMDSIKIRNRFVSMFLNGELWMETDFNSMESNVRGAFLESEKHLFQMLLPARMSRCFTAVYDGIYSGNSVRLKSKFFEAIVQAIRLSGQFWTSIGNSSKNFLWITMINLVAKMGFDNAIESVRRLGIRGIIEELHLSGKALFEGDDGVFRVPPGVSKETFDDIALKCGLKLKALLSSTLEGLHFCGNRLSTIFDADQRVNLRDPFEVLASITHVMGQADSAKHDLELLVSRCVSRLIELPCMPLVSVYCSTIIEKNGKLLNKMKERLKEYMLGHKVAPAWAQELIAKSRGHHFTLLDFMGFTGNLVHIPESVRNDISRLTGLTVAAQESMESRIRSQILIGRSILDIGALRQGAMKRMEVFPHPDMRLLAHEMAQEIAQNWQTVKFTLMICWRGWFMVPLFLLLLFLLLPLPVLLFGGSFLIFLILGGGWSLGLSPVTLLRVGFWSFFFILWKWWVLIVNGLSKRTPARPRSSRSSFCSLEAPT